jgi:ankyrin repeat protein
MLRGIRLKILSGSAVVLLASALSLAAEGTLIDAVKNGNLDEVRALLKQRVDVNAIEGDGSTALHWASHLDNLPGADLLIRAGANVNAANDIGVTPLYLACTNRNGRMVDRLVTAGANPNAILLSGETVLMECARTGDLDAVKALLAGGANVNAMGSSHAQTALMWAAAQRHAKIVAALIESGADVRARSRTYQSIVTSEGQGLEKRKDPAELNYTVLRGGSTPLLFAARSDDVESARLLLAAGADVNDALPDGTSALTLAAHSGNEAVATLLLEKGANPNEAGVGYTPLHAAVLRGEPGLVKALLTHRANPNVRITAGTPIRRSSQDFAIPKALIGATPYFMAAKFLEVEIMRTLIAAGADPALGTPDGTTPLMAAAGTGASLSSDRRGVGTDDGGGRLEPQSRVLDAVQAAIDLGGDVNATNQAGNTALHSAAFLGYDSVVQRLVDRNAAVNAKNKRGQTPLAMLTGREIAAANAVFSPVEGAFPSTVALLRKLGATD